MMMMMMMETLLNCNQQFVNRQAATPSSRTERNRIAPNKTLEKKFFFFFFLK